MDHLDLPLDAWNLLPLQQLIQKIQQDQDVRWQSGQGLLVEHYLKHYPAIEQETELLLGLILNEVNHREALAQKFTMDEYVKRFPAIATRLEMQLHRHSMSSKALPDPDHDEEATETYAFQTTDEGISAGGGTPPQDSSRTVGRFIIRKELGQGSFGIVYQAYDPTLERDVALKVPKRTDQQDQVERFVREAKAAAKLQHPNIVTVFDCSAEPGQSFIAMEWVDGVPLHQQVERYRPNHQQVAKWLRDLALALHAAHEQGILHRDVKPANIMVDKQNRVRLMDFGLAKKRKLKPDSSETETGADKTVEGAIVGTPAYMSPEQAMGIAEKVHFASDQFSLGVVGYQLLTEKRPLKGKMMELLAQLRDPSLQIVPLREQDKTVPLGLEAIIMKSLHRQPGERYESLAAMALDLHRWLKGDEIKAPVIKARKSWKCPSCQRLNAKSKTRCVYCKHHLGGGVPVDWTEQPVIPMKSRRTRTSDEDDDAPRFRVHRWEWGILIVCLLLLGFIPILQRVDRQALETGRLFFGMREVGSALLSYQMTFGHFPSNIVDKTTGEPLLSWRVSILPFLEQEQLYRKFHLDEPWDSEHNKALLAEMPEIFDESLPATLWFGRGEHDHYTTAIQGFAGKSALFEPDKKIRLNQVFDGTAQTIALAEAQVRVPWTKPVDMPFDEKSLPALGKPGAEQFHAVLLDSAIYQLNPHMSAELLRGLITTSGGEMVKLDDAAVLQQISVSPVFWRKNSEGEPYRPLTRYPSHRPRHWSQFSGWINYWVIESGEKIWIGAAIVLALLLAKFAWVWNFYRKQSLAG
ncbi:MAG: protein kinase [Planctomycetia bacterium]|nr:protein kinase [Planctomycetia bacterium]